MVVAPCSAESDYQAATTITFPNSDMSYSPKCARISKGDTITFMGSGAATFGDHPLEPSRRRGNTTDNPITSVTSGTSRQFTFPTGGFFAYYCVNDGAEDMDSGEVGVVWVQ